MIIFFQELVQNLSRLSGFDFSEYIQVSQVADTIISMIANNASIPKWSIDYKYDILFAKDYYFRYYYGDKEIAKLVAGLNAYLQYQQITLIVFLSKFYIV